MPYKPLPNRRGRFASARTVDEAQENALITIEDTGQGIPKEALDQIFDPFFTLKDEGLGTGLGLSIVYGIVEKHRGTIAVESTVGEGTRFTIRIPLQPAGQENEAGTHEARERFSWPTTNRLPGKIWNTS